MNSFLLFMAVLVGLIIFIELDYSSSPTATEQVSINTLTYSNEKDIAAVGTKDGHVVIWDANLDDERFELTGHKFSVENLMFSRDGSWLLSTDAKGKVILWSTRTGELVKHLMKLSETGFPQGFKSFIDIDADCRCLIFELEKDSVVYYNYKTETMSAPQPIL